MCLLNQLCGSCVVAVFLADIYLFDSVCEVMMLREMFSHSVSKAVSRNVKNILHAEDNVEIEKVHKYAHEDLVEMNKNRRALLTRVKRFNVGNITTSVYGTVIPNIASAPTTWYIIILYIGLRILIQRTDPAVRATELPVINTTLVSIIGGFLSFFLVFFVSQAYSRLNQQYDAAMKCKEGISVITYFSRVSLSPCDAWRLWRYMQASHVLGFCGLSRIYTEANIFDVLNEKYKLLTPEETLRVKEIGVNSGSAHYKEVTAWALELLYEQCNIQRQLKMDDKTMQVMMRELMTMQSSMNVLYNFADQPIPFVYAHLLSFLTVFYLPLVTYTVAIYLPTGSKYHFPDILGGFVVFLVVLFVVGTREIGRMMLCPFEDNPCDLSVLHFLNTSIQDTRCILSGNSTKAVSLNEEEDMELARPKKGVAFDSYTMPATSYIGRLSAPSDSSFDSKSTKKKIDVTLDVTSSTASSSVDYGKANPLANTTRSNSQRITVTTSNSSSSTTIVPSLPNPWQRQKGEENNCTVDYLSIYMDEDEENASYDMKTATVSESNTPAHRISKCE